MEKVFDLDQMCNEARERLNRSIGQLARQAKVRTLKRSDWYWRHNSWLAYPVTEWPYK